ncbi:unnamed protein product [Brassicogethes aeneus]|uniref:Uncharacterized protein n=1 Tax=Brassicogethes aeneus TaxID=1431903 RepID=A0A9P0ASQ9_BRAAE|nr:unnamed protein product [Brassicogethes aeneus]
MLNPSKVGQNSQKVNEKRATNSTTPDDDEQVPKRRLIRSQSAKSEPMDNSADNKYIMSIPQSQEEISKETEISVNLKATELNSEETESSEDSGISEDIKLQESTEKDKGNEEQEKEAGDGEPKFESAKEKQCWDMFCKMSGKGINVSYDTILRGILTPTEYRISRKGSIVASFDKDSVP